MKINLRHFLALATIAECGRLATAAERLHLSQPALTQALRKLEASAGTPLFERSGFGVRPTMAGKALVRRSGRASEFLSTAEQELLGNTTGPGQPFHRQVTVSQLRALVAIVETGGYSTASRRLGLSQPTVHRAAKDLEQVVGFELFSRATRGVTVTEEAIVLARYASLVFAEIRQGLEEIWEMQGRTDSRVAIGSLPLVRSEFLPIAVTQLLSRYPSARVSILDGPYAEQLHALRCGQVDWLIGAIREPSPAADIEQKHLFDQPLTVVVRPGHPMLDAGSITIEELAALDWIVPRPLAPARKFFNAYFEGRGVAVPGSIIECSSLVATRGLLLKSDRAALLSPLQAQEDVSAGKLAILVDNIPGSLRAIGMATRKDWAPTFLQEEFDRILRSVAKSVRSASMRG